MDGSAHIEICSPGMFRRHAPAGFCMQMGVAHGQREIRRGSPVQEGQVDPGCRKHQMGLTEPSRRRPFGCLPRMAAAHVDEAFANADSATTRRRGHIGVDQAIRDQPSFPWPHLEGCTQASCARHEPRLGVMRHQSGNAS
jgi:hypothetical protein